MRCFCYFRFYCVLDKLRLFTVHPFVCTYQKLSLACLVPADTSTVMPSFSWTSEPQTCLLFTTLTLFSTDQRKTHLREGKERTIIHTIEQQKRLFKDGRQKRMNRGSLFGKSTRIVTWKFARYHWLLLCKVRWITWLQSSENLVPYRGTCNSLSSDKYLTLFASFPLNCSDLGDMNPISAWRRFR